MLSFASASICDVSVSVSEQLALGDKVEEHDVGFMAGVTLTATAVEVLVLHETTHGFQSSG